MIYREQEKGGILPDGCINEDKFSTGHEKSLTENFFLFLCDFVVTITDRVVSESNLTWSYNSICFVCLPDAWTDEVVQVEALIYPT